MHRHFRFATWFTCLAALLAACDGPARVGPTLPGPLASAADSAAARQAFAAARPRLALIGVAGIPLRAGDRARVLVVSASTTRCERIATSDAVDTVAIAEAGTCRGAENYGVGASAVLGPAAHDGALRVYLPLAAGGAGL